MQITWRVALRILVCAIVTSLIVLVYSRLLHVNPTTVALTFFLAVLSVAAAWGLRYAIPLSIAATLCFNFFFLPPLGTFTIADTQNWIALLAFFVTSIIASQLSERARRQAREANLRKQEVERLYTLSQQLLVSENVVDLLKFIPRYVTETFGVNRAALYVSARDQSYRSDPQRQELPTTQLKDVAARNDFIINPAAKIAIVPVRLGLRVVGALGISGAIPSRATLDAASSLIATAIERARTIDEVAHVEASRESERLRSALLDSVTHELRTPLTSIKASVTTLRTGSKLTPEQEEDLLAVIDEESDRLNRLVGEAVEMAQLDAREVKLDLQPHAMREVVDAAVAESRQLLSDHPVEIRVPEHLPRAMMDVTWFKKVMQHLLENAAKYSPPGSPIF
ncbi:MAG TPA: DUF4118 domain-containing protein, partial [Terriglobales bacterium]